MLHYVSNWISPQSAYGAYNYSRPITAIRRRCGLVTYGHLKSYMALVAMDIHWVWIVVRVSTDVYVGANFFQCGAVVSMGIIVLAQCYFNVFLASILIY